MMSPFIYDVEVGPNFRHMHEWKSGTSTLMNLKFARSFVAPVRILYSEPCVSRTRASNCRVSRCSTSQILVSVMPLSVTVLVYVIPGHISLCLERSSIDDDEPPLFAI